VGVKGVGVDIVDLGAFAASLAEPGTRFARVFSATELRQSREAAERRGRRGHGGLGGPGGHRGRPGSAPDTARHLAARWAAKEAVIKAWSGALYGAPPPIGRDELDWAEISVVCDAWGRPGVRLTGRVAAEVAAGLGPVVWHLSLSHDGPSAIAYCVLEGRPEQK